MIEDLVGVASQATRLFDLAREAGIEPSWKLAVFIAASWAITEALRRMGKVGGCAAARSAVELWRRLRSGKPLCEEEQSLLDALENGWWNEDAGAITSRNRRAVAMHIKDRYSCLLLRVSIDGNDVENGLSKHAKKKIENLISLKKAEYQQRLAQLERETAQQVLRKLNTPQRQG